ncbi:response regulator [Deltaproteobacteria bacterium TL4]
MSRILVIDDDKVLRETLGEVLEKMGYRVACAVNGKAGIRLFEQDPFDLVITDIVMPERDGIETIIWLRNKYPEINIIAISGRDKTSSSDYLYAAGYFGAIYTFTKPIELNTFKKTVQEILEGPDSSKE